MPREPVFVEFDERGIAVDRFSLSQLDNPDMWGSTEVGEAKLFKGHHYLQRVANEEFEGGLDKVAAERYCPHGTPVGECCPDCEEESNEMSKSITSPKTGLSMSPSDTDRNEGAMNLPAMVHRESIVKRAEYQPKTGESCSCKPGIERDNCSRCEGTGMKIDFRKIREASLQKTATNDVPARQYTTEEIGYFSTSFDTLEKGVNQLMQTFQSDPQNLGFVDVTSKLSDALTRLQEGHTSFNSTQQALMPPQPVEPQKLTPIGETASLGSHGRAMKVLSDLAKRGILSQDEARRSMTYLRTKASEPMALKCENCQKKLRDREEIAEGLCSYCQTIAEGDKSIWGKKKASEHFNTTWVCPYCGLKFGSKEEVLEHSVDCNVPVVAKKTASWEPGETLSTKQVGRFKITVEEVRFSEDGMGGPWLYDVVIWNPQGVGGTPVTEKFKAPELAMDAFESIQTEEDALELLGPSVDKDVMA